MGERFLTALELSRGPDALRPGSATGHLGRGEVAWITTRFPLPNGRRVVTRPASVGHEQFLTNEDVLLALFGPDLPAIREAYTFRHELYEPVPGGFGVYRPTGRWVVAWDHPELRLKAETVALFGRFGTIRGMAVLMCWSAPEGWEELLRITVAELGVPADAVLTVGRSEVGRVGDITGGAA